MRREVWPVMLTPYTQEGALDFGALRELIAWYEANGVHGLFAVCQSSEMFALSLRERVELAAFVKRHAKVPVIASGHVAVALEDQVDELRRIADTGVDAVVLITNRMACDGEGAEVWMDRLQRLMDALDPSAPLGLYECPHPYKRLLSDDELRFCAGSGRFRFLKDTCCDLATLQRRAAIVQGTPMMLYNANTTTLLDSLRAGAAGFSGVMANFHPDLYVWLMEHPYTQPALADQVQAMLTLFSKMEGQYYPVSAKYHLQTQGLPVTLYSRVRPQSGFTETYRDEVRKMAVAAQWVRDQLPGSGAH